MHQKAQLGKDIDGAMAAQKTIVGKEGMFLLFGWRCASDVAAFCASRQI
jgi:hypothetical protein